MRNFKKYLDPISSSLVEILSTEGITSTTQLDKQEFPYLIDLIKLLDKEITHGLNQMDNLTQQIEDAAWTIENETGDDKSSAINVYNKLLGEMHELIKRVNRSLGILDSPYFGKIVFKPTRSMSGGDSSFPVYIGKFAYIDSSSGRSVISDWRAPISNLYYSYSGPTKSVSFLSPSGLKSGDLTEKYQLETSGGRINAIYDQRSGNSAVDAFLLKELSSRSGDKLADIVSTIQAQQNDIIRADIDTPLLIQGVAGSGKTTIILHRIAYLMYAHSDVIDSAKSLIIAPNKLFLDYISDVLPSLGVVGMNQNTFVLWAKNLAEIADNFVLDDSEQYEIREIKGSARYIEHIEKFFEQFTIQFFSKMPSTAAIEIEEEFYNFKEKYNQFPFKEAVELTVDAYFLSKRAKRSGSDSIAIRSADEDREQRIKQYVRSNLSTMKIYNEMYKYTEIEGSPLTLTEWRMVKDCSSALLNTKGKIKKYALSDLAPLVMIKDFLFGRDNEMYDHILVDEAQDLSPFQILTLAHYAKRGNITIAGDTAQSIIPPFYHPDWLPMIELLNESIGKEVQFHTLSKSYRSTVEIIKFANKLLENAFPSTYKLPEAVLRSGAPVEIVKRATNKSDADSLQLLREQIRNEVASGSKSIAIICRTEADATRIYEEIRDDDFDMPIYSHQMENFHDGIQVLMIQIAKGLEFASVIIPDLSEANYDSQYEARLLYVALTRALHRLTVIYPEDQPSIFLKAVI